MTDEETDLQGCEHCDNEFDIEHMVRSGDVWLCPTCILEWDKTFDACKHAWEDSHHDGDAGKYCSKCSGFVEAADFAAFFCSPQETASE